MNDTAQLDRLDAVLRDLTAAAELVRAGEAVTVTVSGLMYGDRLLPAAREIAADMGVEVDPVWWSDDVGCDLRVHAAEASTADEGQSDE